MHWDATEKPKAPRCPQCGYTLRTVFQSPDSSLNQYRFDAIKAGDYYCDVCPPNNRSSSNRYCYWWRREVFPQEETYTL